MRIGKAKTTRVTVEPRWAAPLEPFVIQWSNGTAIPAGAAFTDRTEQIRAFVQAAGGSATKEAIKQVLGFPSDDAARKAFKRATDQGAVTIAGDRVSVTAITGQPDTPIEGVVSVRPASGDTGQGGQHDATVCKSAASHQSGQADKGGHSVPVRSEPDKDALSGGNSRKT